jgi:hypothetical protein
LFYYKSTYILKTIYYSNHDVLGNQIKKVNLNKSRKSILKKILLFNFIFLCTVPYMILSQETGKPVVAIIDFSGEGTSEAERIALTNLFVSTVFETGIVDVIDRSQREEILSEIEFSISDCADEECAIEIGRLLSADLMIVGSLNKIGSRLSLDLKAIDVETSKITGTFFKLFESIDEIVDTMNSTGEQFVQNFTGVIIKKRLMVGVEDLAVLNIICENEGASVFIDGDSIGKINDGQITKTVNRSAEIRLVLRKDGFYEYEDLVAINEEVKTVEVTMDEKINKWFAIEGAFGGGMMGSVHLSLFIIPNWWFVSGGIGFTIASVDPILINIPFSVKTGTYIFNDLRKPFRIYIGEKIFWNQYRLFEWENIWIDDSDFLESRLNVSIFSGIEYRLWNNLRLATDIDIIITSLFWSKRDEKSWIQLSLLLRLM